MKKLIEFLKNKDLVNSFLNVILGIFMVVALAIYGITGSGFWLCPVVISGALLNISQGFVFYRDKKKRSFGMSMIMMGLIIIVIVIGLMAATGGEIFR